MCVLNRRATWVWLMGKTQDSCTEYDHQLLSLIAHLCLVLCLNIFCAVRKTVFLQFCQACWGFLDVIVYTYDGCASPGGGWCGGVEVFFQGISFTCYCLQEPPSKLRASLSVIACEATVQKIWDTMQTLTCTFKSVQFYATPFLPHTDTVNSHCSCFPTNTIISCKLFSPLASC